MDGAEDFGQSHMQAVKLVELFWHGAGHSSIDYHNESGFAVNFNVRGPEFEWAICKVVRRRGEFRINAAPMRLPGSTQLLGRMGIPECAEVIADAMQAAMEEVLGRRIVRKAAVVEVVSCAM